MKHSLLLAAALMLCTRLCGALPAPAQVQWSKDGTRVLVAMEDVLSVYEADGALVWSAPAGETLSFVALSPDGRRVAFVVAGRDAWVVDLGSGERTAIFSAAAQPRSCGGLFWSPSGDRLLASVSDYAAKTAEVISVKADGSDRRVLASQKR